MKETLENILKPVKWVDEQVLKQYTKVSKKFNLDEGKRKYWIGMGLNTAFIFLTWPAARKLGGPALDWSAWAVTGLFDGMYNWHGISGRVRDENVSDTRVVDSVTHFYKRYNSVIRLPALVAGISMVGKYGVDLFNNITNGTPMSSDSLYYLDWGLGLISVSASMYIKDTDPKLLEKKPLWKKAYSWAKEKLSSLVPEPAPAPQLVPVRSYSTSK